jgi:hypothetical protein
MITATVASRRFDIGLDTNSAPCIAIGTCCLAPVILPWGRADLARGVTSRDKMDPAGQQYGRVHGEHDPAREPEGVSADEQRRPCPAPGSLGKARY